MRKFVLISMLLLYVQQAKSQEYTFDFNNSSEGWSGNFADWHPSEFETDWDFKVKWQHLPKEIDSTQNGILIAGMNRSDDLFMFLKKRITGLTPNSEYNVFFNIEFVTNYSKSSVGVGGSPGGSVVLKAGVTNIEPDTVFIEGNPNYYRMNIDIGNQSNPGKDMDTIGVIGVNDNIELPNLTTRSNANNPFLFKTGNSDHAWLIVGTDSGFEGKTSLIYNRISFKFEKTNNINNFNNTFLDINITDNRIICNKKVRKIRLYDFRGKLVLEKNHCSSFSIKNNPTGIYIAQFFDKTRTITEKFVITK